MKTSKRPFPVYNLSMPVDAAVAVGAVDAAVAVGAALMPVAAAVEEAVLMPVAAAVEEAVLIPAAAVEAVPTLADAPPEAVLIPAAAVAAVITVAAAGATGDAMVDAMAAAVVASEFGGAAVADAAVVAIGAGGLPTVGHGATELSDAPWLVAGLVTMGRLLYRREEVGPIRRPGGSGAEDQELRSDGATVPEIMRRTKLSKASVYRALNA